MILVGLQLPIIAKDMSHHVSYRLHSGQAAGTSRDRAKCGSYMRASRGREVEVASKAAFGVRRLLFCQPARLGTVLTWQPQTWLGFLSTSDIFAELAQDLALTPSAKLNVKVDDQRFCVGLLL